MSLEATELKHHAFKEVLGVECIFPFMAHV